MNLKKRFHRNCTRFVNVCYYLLVSFIENCINIELALLYCIAYTIYMLKFLALKFLCKIREYPNSNKNHLKLATKKLSIGIVECDLLTYYITWFNCIMNMNGIYFYQHMNNVQKLCQMILSLSWASNWIYLKWNLNNSFSSCLIFKLISVITWIQISKPKIQLFHSNVGFYVKSSATKQILITMKSISCFSFIFLFIVSS